LEEIQTVAAGKNCSVVVAADNELQFDLDSQAAWGTFLQFYTTKLAKRWHRLPPFVTWKSSGGNTHAVVTLPEALPVPERIALQAMGGSDPGREFASLTCWGAGSGNSILLYKPLAGEEKS
jgi:hypothetical protein